MWWYSACIYIILVWLGQDFTHHQDIKEHQCSAFQAKNYVHTTGPVGEMYGERMQSIGDMYEQL